MRWAESLYHSACAMQVYVCTDMKLAIDGGRDNHARYFGRERVTHHML